MSNETIPLNRSDAEQLARIAPVPVMLVRQSQSVIVTATPGQGGTPA
jgi:hypothetical protein